MLSVLGVRGRTNKGVIQKRNPHTVRAFEIAQRGRRPSLALDHLGEQRESHRRGGELLENLLYFLGHALYAVSRIWTGGKGWWDFVDLRLASFILALTRYL